MLEVIDKPVDDKILDKSKKHIWKNSSEEITLCGLRLKSPKHPFDSLKDMMGRVDCPECLMKAKNILGV